MIINFSPPKDNRYHQYCIFCYFENVTRILENGKTFYHCEQCGKISPRLLVIDPNIVWWIDKETKEYWHESVGVFVFNHQKQALFFERVIYPFAFTIPAGHLDQGELPLKSVERELFEEAGIKTQNLKLFSTEDVIDDECRRGADNHRWHLYVALLENGSKAKLNDEGVKPQWLTLEEALNKELTYPVKYFIEKYNDRLFCFG